LYILYEILNLELEGKFKIYTMQLFLLRILQTPFRNSYKNGDFLHLPALSRPFTKQIRRLVVCKGSGMASLKVNCKYGGPLWSTLHCLVLKFPSNVPIPTAYL